MKAFIALFAAAALMSSSSVDAGRPLNGRERVYAALFSDYVREAPPLREANSSVDVFFGMAPIWFNLDEANQLEAKIWGRYKWDDYRLAWNPEDFDGVDQIRVDTSELWTPDIVMYNKGKHYGKANQPQRVRGSFCDALVFSSGMILWVPEVDFTILCGENPEQGMKGLNLEDPWAEQHCSIKVGSWTYSERAINLKFYSNQSDFDTSDYNDASPIQLNSHSAVREVKYYDCCPDVPYVSLKYDMTFQKKYTRASNGLGSIKNPKLKAEAAPKSKTPVL